MTVIINGVEFKGDNVSFIDGEIFIDGVKQDTKIDCITSISTPKKIYPWSEIENAVDDFFTNK